MVHAGNTKELIYATDAFMSNPRTVTMAGGVTLPERAFFNEAEILVSLVSDTPERAAAVVARHAKSVSGKIVMLPGK